MNESIRRTNEIKRNVLEKDKEKGTNLEIQDICQNPEVPESLQDQQ